jgi:DNA-nicking Smr family endonuclease
MTPPSAATPLPPPRAKPGEDQKPRQLTHHGLDASWDKKLARATLHPDFTLDLHGHSLDAAHARLGHGLAQAIALGARLVLVITGLPRPSEAADRGQRRGAIRAKIMDWIEHGPHASRIAAVRPAHRRHGGAGALYLVMKKPR